MANTAVANASSLNIIKSAEKVITHYASRESLYTPFMGKGPEQIIQAVTKLQKSKGDTIKNHLFAKLGGEGVTSGSLEGNEVALTPYAQNTLIDIVRQAVRLDGEMTEQRSEIELRPETVEELGIWARDFITEVMTYYMAGARGTRTGMLHSTAYAGHAGNAFAAPDTAHRLIAGAAGTEAGLTGSDKMTTAVLDKAIRNIKLLQNQGTPMKAPAYGGKKRYVAFMPSEAFYDLQQDPNFISAQESAGVRGNENFLFSGADAAWKGLLIKEVECGVLLTNGAGGANYARTVIAGAQALTVAYGGTKGMDGELGAWKFIEKDDFDYFDQWGMAIKAILGIVKNRFNSQDLGAFAVDTAYTA